MAHDVFISHARKDKVIADAICEKLESAQIRCWIAERDISAGEDWTEATRNAIGSSRVMVLVLSENANAAPHIQREIAHAFYTRRIIIPLRLTNTLPRRDFLFYLGNVRWFDAFNAPAEQHLDALAASIKEMMPRRTVSGDLTPPPSGIKNSGKDSLRAPRSRTLGILKNVAITASLIAVASLSSFLPWQMNGESSEEGNVHPMNSGPSASLDSLPQAPGDASASKSPYTYTPFGLWAGSKTGPTPVQQGRQDTPSSTPDTQPASAIPSSPSDDQKPVGEGESLGALDTASARSVQEDTTRISSRREGRRGKSRPKSHNGRDSKLQRWRFADIQSRLRTLWHQILARSK